MLAACLPVSRPKPGRLHAHKFDRPRRPGTAQKMPAALLPPPTQATTMSGKRALLLQHLLARLVADHPLEIAHHDRVRMRPGNRADDVEGRLHFGNPRPQRLAHRILERPRAAATRERPRAPSSSMRLTFGACR